MANDITTHTRAVMAQPEFLAPSSFEAVERLAHKMAAAKWVPKSFMENGRPNLPAIEMAIIHGREVGLGPMAAVQGIAIINNMPCIWGDAQIAVVQCSGHLEDIAETVSGEGDAMEAKCVVRRKGRATAATHVFTVAMAKKAGLWNKQGPWTQYPTRMLQLRARSWALRDMFADVLKGLYSAEEMSDVPATATPVVNITPERPKRSDFVAPAEEAHYEEVHDAETGEIAPQPAATDKEEMARIIREKFIKSAVEGIKACTTKAELEAWHGYRKSPKAKSRGEYMATLPEPQQTDLLAVYDEQWQMLAYKEQQDGTDEEPELFGEAAE